MLTLAISHYQVIFDLRGIEQFFSHFYTCINIFSSKNYSTSEIDKVLICISFEKAFDIKTERSCNHHCFEFLSFFEVFCIEMIYLAIMRKLSAN